VQRPGVALALALTAGVDIVEVVWVVNVDVDRVNADYGAWGR
jgi:hypothetical protein